MYKVAAKQIQQIPFACFDEFNKVIELLNTDEKFNSFYFMVTPDEIRQMFEEIIFFNEFYPDNLKKISEKIVSQTENPFANLADEMLRNYDTAIQSFRIVLEAVGIKRD